MYVAFACKCGSSFEVDGAYQESSYQEVWELAKDFVNAHVSCGFTAKSTETKVMNLHFGEKRGNEA
jgi:hypothetical protein